VTGGSYGAVIVWSVEEPHEVQVRRIVFTPSFVLFLHVSNKFSFDDIIEIRR
jgi:hypothetical protein